MKSSLPSLKPLPKLNRKLEQKAYAPKGMTTKGEWEQGIFQEKFKKKTGRR